MIPKILIIGNTSEIFHIGSIFSRASESMNLALAVSDININKYAPSMKYLWGKAFFKLAGKRPIEWWSFNHNTAKLIKDFSPQLVLVTGVMPLTDDVFNTCNKIGAKIVNYLTDSPWSQQNSHPLFIKDLPKYNCIFSTKKDIIPDLDTNGVKQVHFLPFGFDPFLHHSLQAGELNEEYSLLNVYPNVCLIGGADAYRISFIKRFLVNFKGKLDLYGDYWSKDQELKQHHRGSVYGDDFCKVVYKSTINIGIIRRANSDGHSMRSFEIPACSGLGIYEDTQEHRELFQGYPEYGFFTSPEDLADKCNWLLEHPVEREEMRQLGIQLVVKDSNTYSARLKTILEWVIK